MMVNFAINESGQEPDLTKEWCVDYDDLTDVWEELIGYITLACQLEIMWMESDGVTPLISFMSHKTVTRAEFWTVLSRVLRGRTNDTTNGVWYEQHLEMLHAQDYMQFINGNRPMNIEKRLFVWVMLLRVSADQ
jgi:hypothetical protein